MKHLVIRLRYLQVMIDYIDIIVLYLKQLLQELVKNNLQIF